MEYQLVYLLLALLKMENNLSACRTEYNKYLRHLQK